MHFRLSQRPPLLAVTIAAACSIVVFGSLADASGQAHRAGSGTTIPPYTVVFSHGNATLSEVTIGANAYLDVSWKAGKCVGGYDSPPVIFTRTGGNVPTTQAPVMATCRKGTAAKAHRDLPNDPPTDFACSLSNP